MKRSAADSFDREIHEPPEVVVLREEGAHPRLGGDPPS
jgi:hypothetical protein